MARFSWRDPAAGGAVYWNDAWDGYAPSRKRLLGTVAEREVPGVVVLGGDVHSNYVADLKADFDDAKSPVVATEFCGTSITQPVDRRRRASTRARLQPARPLRAQRPARLRPLPARPEAARGAAPRRRPPARPGERRLDRGDASSSTRRSRGRSRPETRRRRTCAPTSSPCA